MSLKRINKHKETSKDIEYGIVGIPNIVLPNISTAIINASTKPIEPPKPFSYRGISWLTLLYL